jgi:PAS domain S-box-containing protein
MTKNHEDTQLRSAAMRNADAIFIARQSAERRSEFYLNEGQRLAHMGSWAFSTSRFFEYWSQELFRIYGLDSINGAPTLEEYLALVHPQDRNSMAGIMERMLEEGSGCDVKNRIVRPGGELRYVRSVGFPVFDDGKLKGIVGTAIDVTEQEQMTQELRRREAHLVEAQRLSQTGSFDWIVLDGEISWSDETFRIFGYDPTATPTWELVLRRVHPDDKALVQRILDRASRDGSRFDAEYRLLMPDGSVKHLHVLAGALKTSSGDVEFLGTVIDVTDRKRAEEERARLEQRLRQAEKMEAIGRFAGGIAHDFNNVLLGILGFGEMIFEETSAASPLRRYAQNVVTAANRGRALAEQILTYSRSQRIKRAPVDLAGVVAETLELVRGSLSADLRLETSAPDLSLVVMGDATQLHQVVMNLCSNAIQAISEGGTVRVALEAADVGADSALSHGTLKPGRYACLTVADSGSGMDEATLSRIFEPFFTTKEIGRGTGLGLFIVYAIVTDLGGSIDVKSALKQGSTFAMYLPLVESAFAAAVDLREPCTTRLTCS